jgi:hypothetical protein
MALVKDQPEDIAEANPDALKDIPEPGAHPLQLEAIDATFVKFVGTSGDLLDNPPEQDAERTYIVKAKCAGFDIRKRKDGERRVVAVMEITQCYERGRVPIVDENQATLYSVSYGDDGLPEGLEPEEREAMQEMIDANEDEDTGGEQ